MIGINLSLIWVITGSPVQNRQMKKALNAVSSKPMDFPK